MGEGKVNGIAIQRKSDSPATDPWSDVGGYGTRQSRRKLIALWALFLDITLRMAHNAELAAERGRRSQPRNTSTGRCFPKMATCQRHPRATQVTFMFTTISSAGATHDDRKNIPGRFVRENLGLMLPTVPKTNGVS